MTAPDLDDLELQARTMRRAGASCREIAAALGISRRAAMRATGEDAGYRPGAIRATTYATR